MAYNEKLANRVREQLANLPVIEEKEMMGGLFYWIKLALEFNSKAKSSKKKK